LSQFRDFNGVLTAPFDRLKAVPGVSLAVLQELKIVEAAAHRLAKAKNCWSTSFIMLGLSSCILSNYIGT